MRLCLLFFLFSLADSATAETNGRVTVGGFLSREDHSSGVDDTTRNDFATLSARLYLNSSKIFRAQDEATLDLRDKNDFFNKVNKEQLNLSSRNNLQLRQASYSFKKKGRGLYGTVGRFPVVQAGSAYSDGAEIGYNWKAKLKYAVFGGYNPRRDDRSYLEFEDQARIYGLYFDYFPKSQFWYNRFTMANAFAQQTYNSAVDRSYWFHNSVYQWNEQSFVSTLFYLDFVPRTYLQNSAINYSQGWANSFTSQITASTVDVIQYRRIQDLRERLEPSPYKEVKIAVKQKFNGLNSWTLAQRYGERYIDNLARRVTSLGVSFPQIFSKRIDLYSEFAYKSEFTKSGSYLKLGSGYFSDIWEFNLDFEGGIEKQTDNSVRHPVVFEFSSGRQFSKRFFVVFSAQSAHDEAVDILTLFAKLTYRFGGKETAPLRDGATPRGRL